MKDFSEIPYLFDKVGRILEKDGKIFRIIENPEFIKLYNNLLSDPEYSSLNAKGLIDTKISQKDIDNSILVLEHSKIEFTMHPCEYTNRMFWDAAYMFINLCKELFCKHGLLISDAHPWNISFCGYKPVFYDFSSLYKGENINLNWFREFEKYFAIPIRLASFSKKTFAFSQEYRREHLNGFGLSIMDKKISKKLLNRKFESISKYRDRPIDFFDALLEWLENNQPICAEDQYWNSYDQSHMTDVDSPKTVKQRFVYEILSDNKPKTVLDLASNKGFYSIMAANKGAAVVAFDYEEKTIDQCRYEVKRIDANVTTVLMNFNNPTPPTGIGLLYKSSFDRFRSDVVLALGLIHHICLVQKMPVYIFCDICKKYTSNGVVLEFVEPTDVHVKKWGVEIPIDYNLDIIRKYMSDKFAKMKTSETITHDGTNRILVYFYN